MLYQYTIYPLECIYKVLYLFFAETLDHYGLALIVLSLMTSFIIHPFMKWAAKLQKEEKHLQEIMKPQIDAIKSESTGAEQYQRIQRLYKRYGYHPVMAIRSAIGVALQIPFLMAAFYMLSKLPDIQGVAWGFVKDLGKPDGLLLGRFNVLPFVMTAVNLLGAYTTKGFSKRDRLQAIVIAGLFLILLYTAPSALLIYWTCNNLWTLLGNIKEILFSCYGIRVPAVTVKGKHLSEWINRMPDLLYVCLGLSLTVCILIPADVYLVNSGELWFTLRDLLKYLVPGAAVLFVVLAAIYFILQKQSLRSVFGALVLGLLLGFWLQSYVINLDYGILDGRTIQWKNFKQEAVLNCIAWTICLVLPYVVLKYLKAEKFVKFAKKVALLVVFVQLMSAFYVAGSTGEKQNRVADNNTILTKKGQFSISSQDNIIVFLLDAFESKTFQQMKKRNPELIKPLAGFTYFPDATSCFGYTDYSLPQMLTNKIYTNNTSYKKYLQNAWKDNPFYILLKNKKYNIGIYSFNTFVNGAEGLIDNFEKAEFAVDKKTIKSFAKLVLFREVPHLLKKHFVIYSGDLRDPVIADKITKPYRENDVVFYRELVKNGLNVQNDKNCFRFYHLKGSHNPYTMDENIQPVAKGKRTTKYAQSIGAFKIVLKYIEEMKNHHIYDNATFLILADHGKHNSVGTAPLVLVKQPRAKGSSLKVNKNAISYTGLQATLLQRFGNESSVFGTPFERVNEKERFFYIVKNAKNQDINMVKYSLTGFAEDVKAYKQVELIESDKDNSDNSYYLGTKIEFTSFGDSAKYAKSGWARARIDRRNIIGYEATCSLQLKDYKGGNLTLSLWVRPFFNEKTDKRELSVYVLGKKLCTWECKKIDRYTVEIPEELIKQNQIEIKFKIEKNPVSEELDKKQYLLAVSAMQIN